MDTLATELLHELKRSSRRNFILAIILLVALIVSNVAWLIYESQWEETDVTTLQGDSATYLENSESGDINYGNYTQSN